MDTAIRPLSIDLHKLRCAVAALVQAVGHEGLLDVLGYRQVDIGVATLTAAVARLSPTSAIRRAIERLLSPDDDPGGSRTRGAIAELASLTHVDLASAPGLAAQLLPSLPQPHQGDLFDANEPDPFNDEQGDLLNHEGPSDLGSGPAGPGGGGPDEDQSA